MGEKKPKQREKPKCGAALPWLSCPCLGPSLDCGASGKRGRSPRPRGAGQRPRSLESLGARQEVDRSEVGGCKMTLGLREEDKWA